MECAGSGFYFPWMTTGGSRTPVPYFSITRVFMLYTSPARQHIVGLFPGLINPGIVVYGDLPLSDHFKPISGHHNRGPFRQADSQQIGILLDHRNDVVPAVASIDVLVDRNLAKEGEAVFVLRLPAS